MRALAHGRYLVGGLVVNPRADEILGEDVALEEIVVVRLERAERVLEGFRQLVDQCVLLWRKLVKAVS